MKHKQFSVRRQQVGCVSCGWHGDSPVKKLLTIAGEDFPIECPECRAVGVKPVFKPADKRQVSQGTLF